MELIKHIYESIFTTFVDIEIFWGGQYDPEIAKFGQIWSNLRIFGDFFIKRVVAKIKQVQILVMDMELIKHIYESIFNTFGDIEIFWGGGGNTTPKSQNLVKFGQIW